jgi:hypothetical protein
MCILGTSLGRTVAFPNDRRARVGARSVDDISGAVEYRTDVRDVNAAAGLVS